MSHTRISNTLSFVRSTNLGRRYLVYFPVFGKGSRSTFSVAIIIAITILMQTERLCPLIMLDRRPVSS